MKNKKLTIGKQNSKNKSLKTKSGITLIALIITIIVMLILVGVTLSVALNGGLISRAQEAKTGTQYEKDKEMLYSSVAGIFNDNAEWYLQFLKKCNIIIICFSPFSIRNGPFTKW